MSTILLLCAVFLKDSLLGLLSSLLRSVLQKLKLSRSSCFAVSRVYETENRRNYPLIHFQSWNYTTLTSENACVVGVLDKYKQGSYTLVLLVVLKTRLSKSFWTMVLQKYSSWYFTYFVLQKSQWKPVMVAGRPAQRWGTAKKTKSNS